MHPHSEETESLLLVSKLCANYRRSDKSFFRRFSVPHDRLFLDALERDLKRERMGLESTTAVVSEPALSFSYDPKRPLFEQFAVTTKSNLSPVESDHEGSSPPCDQGQSGSTAHASASSVSLPELNYTGSKASMESHKSSLNGTSVHTEPPSPSKDAFPPNSLARSPFFNMFALFEGSPTYKQRRKKPVKGRRSGGDEEKDNRRQSLDISSHNVDTSKPLLEATNPIRTQPHNRYAVVPEPGQFRFTSGDLKISPSVPDGRLGQQSRAAACLPAPTPPHQCPLFTCRHAFASAELLQNHLRAHEDDCQGADKHQGNMDVDQQDVEETNAYPTVQIARGAQQLQYPRGGSEIPQFTHVLTSPDGSPTYDGNKDLTYPSPGPWRPQSSESSAYNGTMGTSVPSSGYAYFCDQPQCFTDLGYRYIRSYPYDSSSVDGESRSPSEAPAPLSAASTQSYYSPQHPYSVSAPSNRLDFDPYYPPSTAPAESPTVRRPRSVTPSLPKRAPHARRPSTANEVPTSFGAPHSTGYTSSWRHHSGTHVPRGYHPYAAPAHDHSYGTESSHSSPGSSPFAVSLNTPGSEYPSDSSHAAEYGSEASPQMHAQHREYAAPQLSPHLQTQFAHVVSLESVSPIENMGASYTHDAEVYNDTGSPSQHAGYSGSPESVEATPASYQYTPDVAGYVSRSGSSTGGVVYHPDPIVPAHHAQMRQHYYEQQQVA